MCVDLKIDRHSGNIQGISKFLEVLIFWNLTDENVFDEQFSYLKSWKFGDAKRRKCGNVQFVDFRNLCRVSMFRVLDLWNFGNLRTSEYLSILELWGV